MSFRQNIFVIAFLIITGTPIGYAISRKRRMCVENQITNSRWDETILHVIYEISEKQCLWQCVRHPECMGYNTWHVNGTCELVSAFGTCAEMKESEGSKYVSLGGCDGKVPWNVGRRNWTSDGPCLTWHLYYAYDFRGRCPTGTVRGPAGWACASVLPDNSLYLPGWCADQHAYRVVNEEEQLAFCPGAGYILIVAPECPTVWQPYTVGDPLPPRAVSVSTWKDGSPLYLVAGVPAPNTGWYLGYLLPTVQRTFLYKRGGVKSTTAVRILV